MAELDDRRPRWQRSYQRIILILDAAVLVGAVTTAETLRFGVQTMPPGASITYTMLGVLIAAGWWLALQLDGASDQRILGHGPEEYRRVAHASVMSFGILAIVTLLLRQDLSRGYLAIAFPAGLLGLLATRKLLRVWLIRHRRTGRFTTDVLIVGGMRSARSIAANFERHPGSGLKVTGVWTPDASGPLRSTQDLPGGTAVVMGERTTVAEAVAASGARMVVVTDSEQLGHRGLKELMWELPALGVDLMVSPNVMDVSTPRLTLRTISDVAFLHVEKPTFEGATRWTKMTFDKVTATMALVLLSPLLVATAVAVRCTSRGPILYRSERVGADGVPFMMLKFRSMVENADQLLDGLESDHEGVLFKKKMDPRVTRVGRVLRRYSIDELPQLLNVLRGEMSIVGPRPPLRSEVDLYSADVERRLLVKQGITGLWQVSGRSDLSWEESVRLDLDYVENWSLMRDIHIIWRTARAAATGRGAY